MINLKELIGYWNHSLPEKVDYADLVCAPAFAYGYKKVYEDEYGYMVEDTIKALEELQKYRGRNWIAISERLPEVITGNYLVCLKNGAIIMANYSSISKQFKEISSMGIREFYEDNNVIAWKELPEPYEMCE